MGDPAITSGEEAACPAARVVVRRPDPGSVVLTLTGTAGRDDAAVLSRWMHRELDRQPRVIVVRLELDGPPPDSLRQVVRAAHARARREGVGLRVVVRTSDRPGIEVPEPT